VNILSWTDAELDFEPAYNVHGKRLFPWQNLENPDWESAWVMLPPGEVSTPHSHGENEIFFIVEGAGKMRVDDESRDVAFGDTIYIRRGSEHELANHGTGRLVYLSVWWTPSEASVRAARGVTG